ncbi:MAG: hypothetical protein GY703_09805 [Gammaproteobacteria bacterium]|nr:hypothetical protein [Gammaproteobacteria bacterium]
MTPLPFSSPAALRRSFEAGLSRLLTDYDELGTYILVLANAAYDKQLWAALGESLGYRFEQFASNMSGHSTSGLVLDDAMADLHVFRQLLKVGFDRLSTTEFRQVGPWELQYNQLRSFRPPRLNGKQVSGITIPFDHAGFHFNKLFLRKEILWQGYLQGRRAALFYNKYPFVELHGLLVPEPRRELPQLLTEEDNDYLWRLTTGFSMDLPGVGFGYNSYGACASVNQLHFQMYHRDSPLPVSNCCWRHNGGTLEFPVPCHRFDCRGDTWRFIDRLHKRQISYNMLYLPGHAYCLPRRKQGSYASAPWIKGLAWYELAGGFTLFDKAVFKRLERIELESELARLSLEN